MSHRCAPTWNLDDEASLSPNCYMRSHSNSSCCPDVPKSNYEVAELTWENGQLSLHGLGLPRVPCKPEITTITGTANSCHAKYTWDKPRANGTLESIVNQATRLPHHGKQTLAGSKDDELVLWIEHPKAAPTATTLPSATMTMDALVPCSNRTDDLNINIIDPIHDLGTCVVSTHVESCSEATSHEEDYVLLASKRAKVASLPMQDLSSRDQSVSTSDTFGMDKSQQISMNTYEKELGSLVFTSTSMGSPENTNSWKQSTKANTSDDHDSVCHSRLQEEYEKEKNKGKSSVSVSVSTRRSRAAAIHNQSERKRRDKINQRMKTLQKLVPNSSKTDKASMLEEVIEYLKQLQAQVQMMSRMNMPPVMMPMTMQQQFQMSSMMASMAMGLGMAGMGMGMGGVDVNNVGRPNIHGIPQMLHPSLFMPTMPTWDTSTDHYRLQTPAAPAPADPLSTFLACQTMTMDQYSKMATMYQHLQQPPATNSKS